MSASNTPHRILIVDDEPDVAAVTRLSLKGLKFGGRGVEFEAIHSGKEAVEAMRKRPDTSVILLDVVMESSTAGLDACRAIREELGNRFVRILLRTGQPGIAPEKQTIEEFDIDGYLPKAELTTNRLYAAVRSALKSYDELVELERHRRVLSLVHTSALSLQSYEPLEATLQRILAAAASIAPSSHAVFHLDTFEADGTPRAFDLRLSSEDADSEEAEALIGRLAASPEVASGREATRFGEGVLVPLRLHRELGHGWIHLACGEIDELSLQALTLIAAHAENALYSAVAQQMLSSRERPFYDSLIV